MKLSRCLPLWTTFALCGGLVVGAMGWLTRGVMASERERALAEARADLEECTRLALWRMDAAGAAIVSAENAYAAADYQAAGAALALRDEPLVKLHFELREGRKLTSPKGAGESGKLADLRVLLGRNPLAASEWSLLSRAAEESESVWNAVPKDAGQASHDNAVQRQTTRGGNRVDETYQLNFNGAEKSQRAKSVEEVMTKSMEAAPATKMARQVDPPPSSSLRKQSSAEVRMPPQDSGPRETGAMRAIWIGGELFLLRQVSWLDAGTPVKGVQGVWLDQAQLRARLLGDVKDLLPKADLVPAMDVTMDPLALVSFPLKLVQNEVLEIPRIGINGPLAIGWVAVLFALGTTTLLIQGVMRLSNRRASFVSAVTHELRTPLTTFRLYSDMLETGAVKEEKKADYLKVLSREADRLSHLVENVLSFSKIERGSARAVTREASVAELLEPVRERLEARLATCGLTLEMDLASSPSRRRVKVDAASVEHILFNLVDNAAKYACTGTLPVVEISVEESGRFVEISVRDHGPGILPSERKRIFRAFHKSARDAAESQPGVGLGLALSRRLAKSLGGSLDCVSTGDGACFVLRLPFV